MKGKTAVVLRSFVASCQRTGVDPFRWLQDVLSRIVIHPITQLAELGNEKFLAVPEAAALVGVSRNTMYRWASQGKTPRGEKLKVAKDWKTGYYYVSEPSVQALLELYRPEASKRFIVTSTGS